MFCSRMRMLKLEKRGENRASHLPLGLLFLLSLIFLRHHKDGGYISTNINKQLSPAQNTPALQATGAETQLSATHCLVRSRLRVKYYGKRGRKKYSPLALCVRSHHSPLAPCARCHHPPLAFLTCLQLSRFSLVSCFPLSRRKAWGGGRATETMAFYCLFWYRLFETNERLKHLPMSLMQEDSLISVVRLTFLRLCILFHCSFPVF